MLATSDRGGTPGSAAAPWARQEAGHAWHRAGLLLAEALDEPDAETLGVRAGDVLASVWEAERLLAGPEPCAVARHAVVQRYGRVGALVVVGHEDRVHRGAAVGADPLRLLVECFWDLDAQEMAVALARIAIGEHAHAWPASTASSGDRTRAAHVAPCGSMPVVTSRHWLDATYAVAQRDGGSTAHRAYMAALEQVFGARRQALRTVFT